MGTIILDLVIDDHENDADVLSSLIGDLDVTWTRLPQQGMHPTFELTGSRGDLVAVWIRATGDDLDFDESYRDGSPQ